MRTASLAAFVSLAILTAALPAPVPWGSSGPRGPHQNTEEAPMERPVRVRQPPGAYDPNTGMTPELRPAGAWEPPSGDETAEVSAPGAYDPNSRGQTPEPGSARA
ncbi:uncharacterized protein P884DRAFT_268411 [Thermothelomyces heterothallicus CBS 202.75]|uniref:uncharacterized protein n=1 Tax=Thermothelomyces heterothallicus CBS 202.75 TaxID=1149848 RepID=UPI0037422C81